jgi:hypothetical protein
MKPKPIIIGLLIIILGAAIYVFFERQKPQKAPALPTATIAPVDPAAAPPSLGDVASYTNVPQQVSFPAQLPIYDVVESKTLAGEFSRLATSFSINTPPTVFNGSKGQYFLTQQGPLALQMSEAPLTFTYESSPSSQKTITYTPQAAVDIAIAKLKELVLIPKDITVTPAAYTYLSPEGPSPNATTNAGTATVMQIDFNAFIDGLPLFVGEPSTPVFTTRFDGETSMTQLRGALLPDIKKAQRVVAIISYEAAVARLQAKQGILSSMVATDNKEGFLVGETPQNISVTSVRLGYLLLPKTANLVPVFMFTGTAILNQERRQIQTVTVISALP